MIVVITHYGDELTRNVSFGSTPSELIWVGAREVFITSTGRVGDLSAGKTTKAWCDDRYAAIGKAYVSIAAARWINFDPHVEQRRVVVERKAVEEETSLVVIGAAKDHV